MVRDHKQNKNTTWEMMKHEKNNGEEEQKQQMENYDQ